MWWLQAAWGSECEGLDPRLICACEEQRVRTVNESLAAAEGPILRLTEAAWRASVRSTCAWVEGFGATEDTGTDRCVRTSTCVRLLTEDRLATVTSTSARAIDLQRVTGRSCGEGDKACAIEARIAEEERLAEVVQALERMDLAPLEAQRDWHVYRDGYCDAEGLGSQEDLSGGQEKIAWARAACGAVLAARRIEALATLVRFHDPATADAIDEARWRAALSRLRPRSRPWEDWLRLAGDDPALRGLVREAVEARVDGGLFPPLMATHGWTGCAARSAPVCIVQVHAETSARLEAVRAAVPVSPAEADWREGWCGERPTIWEREACEAEVDYIVASAAR